MPNLKRTPPQSPTKKTPEKRPATRSQHPELLLGVGKHPVAPTRKNLHRAQSFDTILRPATPVPIERNRMVNEDEPAQGAPPALQSWETFRQALCGYRPPLPEFHGRSHEDPVKYLRRCEEYLTAHQVPDAHKTKAIEKGLRHEAEKWWQCYKNLDFEWQRFKDLLEERFDSATVKSELMAALYSQKQNEKEDVGAFLQEKYQLFQRVHPDIAEAQKVQILLNLTKPSLRKMLRPITIGDFPTLMSKALQAEKDDHEEQQVRNKTNSSKETKVERPTTKVESQLPRCWHCPGRHFNKDCEVYKAKQNQHPENWRRTSETPVTNVNGTENRRSATPTAPQKDSRQ